MITALINALTDSDAIYANWTPPAKKNGVKRAGAKTVKAMECVSTEYTLSPEGATNFHALGARSNFLSQDRTDIGFSTKELCWEIAVPNRNPNKNNRSQTQKKKRKKTLMQSSPMLRVRTANATLQSARKMFKLWDRIAHSALSDSA